MFHAGGRFIADPYEWFRPLPMRSLASFKSRTDIAEHIMNFYRRFPGDYLRDTGTLTLQQHGAYCVMLDYHYSTEMPLPTGDALYLLLRATTKVEKAAVDFICENYWSLIPEGYINRKAVKEFTRTEKRRVVNAQNARKRWAPIEIPS